MTFKPMTGKIFVTDMEEGEKLSRGGIIILDDNKKEEGIRPRWSKVASLGDGVDEVEIDQWILLPHGRWTLRFPIETKDGSKKDVWMVERESIMMVSDEKPF